MNQTPLDGRAGAWLRQLSDCAEADFPAVFHTLTTDMAGDLLVVKVADGLTPQGVIDAKTPINSPSDLASVIEQGKAAGVLVIPVVVPRGVDPAAEAAFHASFAAVAPALVTDIEYGIQMWDGSVNTRIPAYCQALRAAAPSAYLINQPDPRPYGLQSAMVAETARYYNGIAAQHYVGWNTNGVVWTDVALEVTRYNALAQLGLDMHVTLWGVGDRSQPLAFYQQIAASCHSFHVFSFGAMSATDLTAFSTYPRYKAPIPQPPPPGPKQAPFDAVARLSLLPALADLSNDARDLTNVLAAYT